VLISPLLVILQKKLRTSSLAQLFSTSQTASNAVIPTALAHNYSSTPHHNLAPPHSRVINLHAHLVAAAMHSFLYNISHTPRERSPHALPCSSNGEGKKKVPSGVKSPHVTHPPWPDNTIMQAAVSTFQSQAVKSSGLASTIFPLG
jgi:hypothetical protein